MEFSAHEKRLVADVFKSDFRLGWVARSLLTGWIILTLFFACNCSYYLLLVWTYGFSRVFKEGLHFTYIPSSKSADDFIVSNGDHISWAQGFVAFPMALLVWLAFVESGVITYKSD